MTYGNATTLKVVEKRAVAAGGAGVLLTLKMQPSHDAVAAFAAAGQNPHFIDKSHD